MATQDSLSCMMDVLDRLREAQIAFQSSGRTLEDERKFTYLTDQLSARLRTLAERRYTGDPRSFSSSGDLALARARVPGEISSGMRIVSAAEPEASMRDDRYRFFHRATQQQQPPRSTSPAPGIGRLPSRCVP